MISLFEILSLLIAQSSQQKEFCTHSQKVNNIFTMGDITYLGKGEVFYTKTENQTFGGKTSVNRNDIFGFGN